MDQIRDFACPGRHHILPIAPKCDYFISSHCFFHLTNQIETFKEFRCFAFLWGFFLFISFPSILFSAIVSKNEDCKPSYWLRNCLPRFVNDSDHLGVNEFNEADSERGGRGRGCVVFTVQMQAALFLPRVNRPVPFRQHYVICFKAGERETKEKQQWKQYESCWMGVSRNHWDIEANPGTRTTN